MTRHTVPLLAAVLSGTACGAPPPADRPVAGTAAIVGTPPGGETFAQILPASTSPVTFERMAAFPPPGWQVPRMVSFSPDGKLVTFLQGEADAGAKMSLFTFELATGKVDRLLTAADLAEADRPMSIEEELRRERQRKRIEGITDYRWAAEHPLMVLSHGGDVFVRYDNGAVRQLTHTEAPELDATPCATGARVAFVRDRELWATDLATGRERALTKGAPEHVTRGLTDFNGQEEFGELHGFFWSPDCQTLAYLEVDESGVGEVPILGFRGGEPQLMMQRFPRAGASNPTVKLGLVDAERGGATRWVSWPGTVEPGSYLGRFVWGPSGLYLQTLNRGQTRRSLVFVDAKTARASELIVETAGAWIEMLGMKLVPGSGELLWITGAGPHQGLALHDATTGARKKALIEGEGDVLSIAGIRQADRHALVLRAENRGTEEHLYAVPIDGSAAARRLTPEPGVHGVEVGPDGDSFVDVHSALDRLPEAVVRSRDGAVAGKLPVNVDADLATLGIRAPELFEATAEDGTTLMGMLLAPEQVEPGRRYPLVWMVYGGPAVQTVQNRYSANLMWQHLADRGFYVAQLDNRGTSGRGPAFAAPIKGRLGEVELRDQIAGLDAVLKRAAVDPERVGIYGHSYGGTMAALALFRAPEKFQVGIAGSPVSSWRLYDTGYTERYMGTPAGNPEGYEATDLSTLVGGLEGQLFILHAMMDENVHFQHSAELIDALIAAKKPFDLLVFPGERHGYRSPAARSYAMQRVVEYLTEHLAPRTAPAVPPR